MSAHAPSVAGLTDTGLTRTANEDSLLVEPPLYAVADGMGGHRAGEVASDVALRELLARAPKRSDAKALGRAVRAANKAVIDAAEGRRTRSGMGTTLTAVMIDGTHLALAHVGDSRAYLLSQGEIRQLTDDHSMVADLMRQGSLTPEEARSHPQRSVITRALGSDPNMLVDTLDVTAAAGDRLLLCTDGLSSMLADDFIAEILTTEKSPDDAARRLIDVANRAGGYDNTTVVVVDIEDTPASEMAPSRGSGESRRRVAARLLWIVAATALVLAAMWGAYTYARSRAYLIEEDGVVAVYRGVPGSFAGVRLSWLVERTDVPVSSLDAPVAGRLAAGIAFADLAQAFDSVEEMRQTPSTPATSPAAPPGLPGSSGTTEP